MAAAIGLVLVAIVLLAGAGMYGSTAFWAGGLAAAGQAVLAGLAAWGLRLAREQEELTALPELTQEKGRSLGGFRMSYGDEGGGAAKPTSSVGGAVEVRTLETGFQRVVVALTATGLLVVAGVISYLVYRDISVVLPGQKPLPTRENVSLDNLAVAMAAFSLVGYMGLFYAARGTRQTAGYGEAVSGTLTMGVPGMVGVAAAVIGGWMGMAYITQIAAVLVAVLLLVQGLELLANSVRSYAGIEEFDQAPVDLQRLPLAPMLTSQWVVGLKGILSHSLGLTRRDRSGRAPGAFARLAPRVVISVLGLAVISSMVRVVRPGEVAIVERLGQASDQAIDHPLESGLHFTAPWPIDELVRIPTQHVQKVTVGAEDAPPQAPGEGESLNYKFWAFKHVSEGEKEEEYITSDRQLLGTVVSVWWRVKDPSKFYRNLSHSELFETRNAGDQEETLVRPIYVGLIQAHAARAVTQTYAEHPLDGILATERELVQKHCWEMLQQSLDELHSGIEVLDLTIEDVHPPVGKQVSVQTANGIIYGPAAAYEGVVRSSEDRQRMIDQAVGDTVVKVNQARGNAARLLRGGEAYRVQRSRGAAGENARRMALAKSFSDDADLVRRWKIYKTMEEALNDVNKIVIGRGVSQPEIWQAGNNGPQIPAKSGS